MRCWAHLSPVELGILIDGNRGSSELQQWRACDDDGLVVGYSFFLVMEVNNWELFGGR